MTPSMSKAVRNARARPRKRSLGVTVHRGLNTILAEMGAFADVKDTEKGGRAEATAVRKALAWISRAADIAEGKP